MQILAIDPGTTESGYCRMEDYRPLNQGKTANETILTAIRDVVPDDTQVVIEMIESFGNAVGQTVFETCVWIGRFTEAAKSRGLKCSLVYRTEEKINLCNNRRAKDSNIRVALIDRFAQHDRERGKGTKANPDWFYGFSKDAWMAYACGVTWLDREKEQTT